MSETIDTSIKFLHIRAANKDFTLSPFGGLTVAYRLDQANNIIYYAVACVSRKDRFKKKIGRNLATERLSAYTDETKCGTVSLNDLAATYTHRLSPEGLAKLNVVDFDWFVTKEAVTGVVLKDERFAQFTKRIWI